MATYLVTAIGAPFQKHNDILGHREHKDTEKNTLQVARSTRRRRAAGEALCLSVSVACPNQYVAVITRFCTLGPLLSGSEFVLHRELHDARVARRCDAPESR